MATDTTHPALVTEQDFVAAQQIRAQRPTADGGTRRYLLRGLVRCGQCGRRMDPHWVHERAGYRCRHGYRSTTSRPVGAPENVYLREDHILHRLALGSDPQVGLGSIQEIAEFLRCNDMVVEVYGRARWALTSIA